MLMLINTKNFFDLKAALGKAELYPDLELPTVEELEKAGFYFMDSLEENLWNRQINRALQETEDPRWAVLDYDWDKAVVYLQNQ